MKIDFEKVYCVHDYEEEKKLIKYTIDGIRIYDVTYRCKKCNKRTTHTMWSDHKK